MCGALRSPILAIYYNLPIRQGIKIFKLKVLDIQHMHLHDSANRRVIPLQISSNLSSLRLLATGPLVH